MPRSRLVMVTKEAHGFACFHNGFKWLKKRVSEKWEIIILEEMGVMHIDLDIDTSTPRYMEWK